MTNKHGHKKGLYRSHHPALFEQMMRQGSSHADFSDHIGVHRNTLASWLVNKPEMRAAWERVKVRQSPYTTYKPAYCKLLVAALRAGKTFRQFAAENNLVYDTARSWLARYEEFDAARREGLVGYKHAHRHPAAHTVSWQQDYRVAARFWSRVEVGRDNQCWIFRGPKNAKMYGTFRVRGRQMPASRVALLLSGVDVPEGWDVCHHCLNPPCVNPQHLYPGTRKQNAFDVYRRGKSEPLNLSP